MTSLPQSGTPPTYDIRTVADFLLVPEDRLDVCLHEFRIMLEMARNAKIVLEAVTDEVTQSKGAVRFDFMNCFHWIDDGEGTVDVHVQIPDGERIPIVSGTLRDDLRR